MATNYLTLYNKPSYATDGSVAPTGSINTVGPAGTAIWSPALTSTMVSIGQSTNQTYTNPANGSYSTWQSLTTATTGLSALANVKKVAMSQTGQYQLIIAGSPAAFYLSQDSGVTWAALTGLPTLNTAQVNAAISANGQTILVAVSGDYLYQSTNGGTSFTAINTASPQVYFPFDGATTDLVGGATGITIGGATHNVTYTAGAVSPASSGAAVFSNTAGSAAATYLYGTYSPGTAFTISGWFNAQTLAASNCVFCLGTTSDANVQMYISSTGMVYMQLYLTGATTVTLNGPVISTNTWNHFMFSYQQGGASPFYINGAYIGAFANTGVLYSSLNRFSFASLTHVNTNSFNGYIDDVRIWNSVIATPPMVKLPWNTVSISGSGSYLLASNTFGQVFQSANTGSTWSLQSTTQGTQSATTMDLPSSYTGQYQITSAGSQVVTPNQTSLATYTWNQNGVTWTASASSTYSSNNAYGVFNNQLTGSGWASASGKYNGGSGTYNGGTASTTLQGIGAVGGEYLQLQTSIPLVLQSHRIASGGTVGFSPKVYYIAGSTDGSTWYPIIYVSVASNPLSAQFTAWSNGLLSNFTGTQAIKGNVTSSCTTQSYSYTTQAFSYFRIIVTSVYTSDLTEFGEFYPVFTTGLSYSSTYGASYTPLISYGDAFNVTKALTVTSAGTGYATLPSYTYAGTGLTFAAWFYLTGAPVQYGRIVDIGNSYNVPTNGLHLFINSNGTFSAGTLTSGTLSQPYLNSNTACAQNTLYHVCWTITSAGVQTLYINGVSDATSVTYVPANTTYTSNFVGRSNWAGDGYANEYIIDFRMFNRALSATEVAALAQANNFNTGPASMEVLAISGNAKYAVGGAGKMVKVDASYLTNTAAGTQTVQALATTGSIMCASVSFTGQYMVVLTNTTTANVWYSTNYGATWTSLTVGSAVPTGCAMSYDGSYITVSSAAAVYTLNLNTKGYSIAMGAQAGLTNQGQNAVAIGNQAAPSNQSANSVVLNATGAAVNTAGSGFYVAPIATADSAASSSLSILGYGSDSQIVKSNSVYIQPSTGYLGIGTANPTKPLTVMGQGTSASSNGEIMISNGIPWGVTTASGQIGKITFDNSGYVAGSIKSVVDTGGANNNGALVFGTSLDFNNIDVERMRITRQGYVGIGTTSPSATMHLYASVGWSMLRLTGTTGNSAVVLFDPPGAVTSSTPNWFMGQRYDNQGPLSIWKYDGTSHVSSYMTFATSGNVGVGTTTPSYALDVYGSIAQSGYRIPKHVNGSFSGTSSCTIPIYFSDTNYNVVEIKVNYVASALCNVTMSARNTSSASLLFSEVCTSYAHYRNQSYTNWTTYDNILGEVATYNIQIGGGVERYGINNNLYIRMVRATGSDTAALRNHFSLEHIFCISGIGSARLIGMGHIDNASVGGAAIGSITLTCSSGNISGTYNTVHSY